MGDARSVKEELRAPAAYERSDRKRYPPDWQAISRRIRDRARGRCECRGECGLHQGLRCRERNGQPARWARGTIVLMVAHMANPDPMDVRDENLKALCPRCHLRFDRDLHRKHAAETRLERKLRQGQLPLPLVM